MIQVRCFHDLPAANAFRQEMNDLNLSSSRPDPFSSFEFYENHLCNVEARAGTSSLWLLLAFDGQRLLGYIALRMSTQLVLGMPAGKIDLLTAHRAGRPHLVVRPGHESEVRAAIYEYLMQRRNQWSLLEFQEQEEDSELLPLPEQGLWSRYQSRRWPTQANGSIAIRWSSTKAYFAALSKKARSNISRQARTLLAAGEVQFLSSEDPGVITALFGLYRGIEKHSWKAQADAGVGRSQRSLAYYACLMEPGQPMRLGIHVLILDGTPIAGLISGSFGKGLYALHIVHDERLSHLAPGSAILLMGVRRAIEGGYEFFNLLRGFGYYKERWLARMTPTHNLQVYRIGTPFYWRRLLGDLGRRLGALWAGKTGGEVTRFNPARRDVAQSPACRTAAAPQPLSSAAEREQYAEWIAQVRRGESEYLSAETLIAAMPFSTRVCPVTGSSNAPYRRDSSPA